MHLFLPILLSIILKENGSVIFLDAPSVIDWRDTCNKTLSMVYLLLFLTYLKLRLTDHDKEKNID